MLQAILFYVIVVSCFHHFLYIELKLLNRYIKYNSGIHIYLLHKTNLSSHYFHL